MKKHKQGTEVGHRDSNTKAKEVEGKVELRVILNI